MCIGDTQKTQSKYYFITNSGYTTGPIKHEEYILTQHIDCMGEQNIWRYAI